MQLTAIEGVVENGRIRLREEVSLAENTRVYVIVGELQFAPAPAQVRTPRLANSKQAKDFSKEVLEIPSDAKI